MYSDTLGFRGPEGPTGATGAPGAARPSTGQYTGITQIKTITYCKRIKLVKTLF